MKGMPAIRANEAVPMPGTSDLIQAETLRDLRDERPQGKTRQPILCVNLERGLLKTDLLWEGVAALLKTEPSILFKPLQFHPGGRDELRREVLRRADITAGTLPYRSDLLEFLRSEHKKGRRLALITTIESPIVESIARHLGIFEEIVVVPEGMNVAEFLATGFRDDGFAYVGSSAKDLPVWQAAREAYVVGGKGLARQAASVARVEHVFEQQPASLVHWLQALRGHHWAKNLLLFLPLLAAHKLRLQPLIATVVGFILFSLCASSIYILNDLLDLHSDRAHPWKAKRPFASGATSVPSGLLISAVLIATTIACGVWLSLPFAITLVAYLALTLWYSLHLKRVPLLDVFVLSCFYGMRICAGAAITSVPLSDWFMAFSIFFFLSLAMAKRYSELVDTAREGDDARFGRPYIHVDRSVLMQLGIGCSFSAVVILALYVHSKEVLALYRRPEYLSLICPVILYWTSRLWLRANRGEINEDPIALAIEDPVSYASATAVITVLLISTYAR